MKTRFVTLTDIEGTNYGTPVRVNTQVIACMERTGERTYTTCFGDNLETLPMEIRETPDLIRILF